MSKPEERLHPKDVAFSWINAVFGDPNRPDYAAAWAMSDENLRLARAQAWAWNNKEYPPVELRGAEACAKGLAEDGPTDPLWGEFAEDEVDQYKRTWPDNPTTWRVGLGRRVTGPDHEFVLFMSERDLDAPGMSPIVGPTGAISHHEAPSPTVVNATAFLLHWVGDKWLVAHPGSDYPPEPGWPPTFE